MRSICKMDKTEKVLEILCKNLYDIYTTIPTNKETLYARLSAQLSLFQETESILLNFVSGYLETIE